jgi:hypothetical protein
MKPDNNKELPTNINSTSEMKHFFLLEGLLLIGVSLKIQSLREDCGKGLVAYKFKTLFHGD